MSESPGSSPQEPMPGSGASGEDAGHIPLEPVSEPAVARPAGPRLARPSVLSLKDDTCPNCHAKMAPDAVVCMACGYDMQANRVLRPEMGVDVVEPPPTLPEFIKPGGSPRVLAIAGACVTVAAMVTAAATGRAANMGGSLAFAALALYRTILHTGTGMVGLWCAAYYVSHRLNHVNLALARMFLALSIFQLLLSAHLPIGSPWLEGLARWPLAAGTYWLALFVLFRRDRQETSLIVLFHLAAYMFVELGVRLAVALENSVVLPAPGAAS